MNLVNSSKSEFVSRLFGQDVLQTVTHPAERTAVMQASVSSKPMRAPSVMSRKGTRARTNTGMRRQQQDAVDSQDQVSEVGSRRGGGKTTEQGAAGQFLSSLENVQKAITDHATNSYFVFCMKPNDRRIANQFDSKCVRSQMQTFGIAEISQRLRSADFSLFLPFGEFLGLADAETMFVGSERERTEMIIEEKRWPSNEVQVGSTGVFVSERCWMEVAQLRNQSATGPFGLSADEEGITPGEPKDRFVSSGTTPLLYGEKTKSGYFGADDTRSEAGVSAFGAGDMFQNLDTREQMAERGNEKSLVEVEEYKDSPSRKRWVFMVYFLTWLIPDFLIRWIGKMPRKDVRMAWREKLAINMLIWLMCGFAAFFIFIFPSLVCPHQYVFSASELSSYDGKSGSKGAYVSVRGYVFDIATFQPHHYPSYLQPKALLDYAGKDISSLFPIQVSALCQGVDGSVAPEVTLDYRSTNFSGSPKLIASQDPNAQYHDFRYFRNHSRPDWYFEQMQTLRGNFKVGNVGYTPAHVRKLASQQQAVGIIGGRVFDLTTYLTGGRKLVGPPGQAPQITRNLQTSWTHLSRSCFNLRLEATSPNTGTP